VVVTWCKIRALRKLVGHFPFEKPQQCCNIIYLVLAQRRRTARMCAFYKAYNGERAWKDIGDRLQAPYYRSRVDHCRKIRSRKIRTDIGEILLCK
jgi:hypothetical protein